MAKKNTEQQVSITYQDASSVRDWIQDGAFRLGLKRTDNKTGKEVGNLSAYQNLMNDYVMADAARFAEWAKKKIEGK